MRLDKMSLAAMIFMCVAGMGLGFGLAQQAPPMPQKNLQAQLKDLLVQRRDILRASTQEIEKAYEADVLSLEQVLESQRELLRAELDLAQTKEQRIAVYRQLAKNLTKHESYVKALYEAERRGGEAFRYHQVKAARMGAEIDLLREQMK